MISLAQDDPVLLVVEDDRQVRLLLARVLNGAGFATTVVGTAIEAKRMAGELKPDLVVLDLGLPDEDGFALQSWLRKRHPQAAILILTGQSSLADRVRGLDGGADDYVVKPFLPDELVARIRSILRRVRSAPTLADAQVQTFLDARLDPDLSCLTWPDGRSVHLTTIEYAIAATMAERPGRVATRTLLLDRIGAGDEVGSRSIDYHVCQMRSKLKKVGVAADAIRSVRGIGYVYRPKG
jgi:DNA-binding response OmpR family regulator